MPHLVVAIAVVGMLSSLRVTQTLGANSSRSSQIQWCRCIFDTGPRLVVFMYVAPSHPLSPVGNDVWAALSSGASRTRSAVIAAVVDVAIVGVDVIMAVTLGTVVVVVVIATLALLSALTKPDRFV